VRKKRRNKRREQEREWEMRMLGKERRIHVYINIEKLNGVPCWGVQPTVK